MKASRTAGSPQVLTSPASSGGAAHPSTANRSHEGENERSPSEVIGVDIGGTKIAFGKVASDEVSDFREVETPKPATPAAVTERLIEALGDLPRESQALGVAAAGAVRDDRVTAVTRANLPEWTDLPLGRILEERTGLPTTVLNDGQAAAWGEYLYGGGRGLDRLVYVTVSTGIGGGLVAGGRLLRGGSGLAGHVGHLTLDPQGPWCSCGRRGCLEQLASGSAIEAMARRLLDRKVTAREVFELASTGEPWAQGMIRDSARWLSRGLASLHLLLDPGLVLIGGGVGLAEGYLEAVRQELSGIPLARDLQVKPAQLGRQAGVIGAAAVARDLI